MQDILLCGWRGQLLREVNKAYKADGMQSTPILVDLRHLPPKKKNSHPKIEADEFGCY